VKSGGDSSSRRRSLGLLPGSPSDKRFHRNGRGSEELERGDLSGEGEVLFLCREHSRGKENGREKERFGDTEKGEIHRLGLLVASRCGRGEQVLRGIFREDYPKAESGGVADIRTQAAIPRTNLTIRRRQAPFQQGLMGCEVIVTAAPSLRATRSGIEGHQSHSRGRRSIWADLNREVKEPRTGKMEHISVTGEGKEGTTIAKRSPELMSEQKSSPINRPRTQYPLTSSLEKEIYTQKEAAPRGISKLAGLGGSHVKA